MNNDFIKIKTLEGDLKISHKKKDLGMTVSTEELVLQKPHVNYHVKLEDIISIVPFETAGSKTAALVIQRAANNEVTNIVFGPNLYKFYVQKAVMHSRSGIFKMGRMELVIPILHELLHVIGEYSGMEVIATR